ncbi:MAG: hypothetical protein EOP56_02895, partial [Sphingobacteriales bacterium]
MKLLVPLVSAFSLLLATQPLQLKAKTGDEKLMQSLSGAPSTLSFIENKGQITDQFNKARKDIDFKMSAPGMSIFVGDGQIHYQWSKSVSQPTPPEAGIEPDREKARAAFETFMNAGTKTETYRMDVVLLGANKAAQVIEENKQQYGENYYLPQYKGAAAAYSRVIYKNVYPNIDWVLYTEDNHLK